MSPRTFVWGTWAVMSSALVACVALYTYNVPLAEDWLLVPPLTGNEPSLWEWLWAQNNEHRLPLPRAVLLAILGVARDFRAGMLASIALMAAAAFILVRALAALRGGRLRYADAFIPVALLHIGNWENFMWSWQLCFVLSSAVTLALLVTLAGSALWTSPPRAAATGALIAILPLCGANGLAFVAPIAAWLAIEGVREWRAGGVRRRAAASVLTGIAIAAGVAAYYFVGYTSATWNPPSPGPIDTLKTSLKFLALGFGPIATHALGAAAVVVIAVLLPAALVTARAALTTTGHERDRAWRLLAYLTGVGALALAFGWGRAGLVPTVGLPDRYVLLAVPALVWAYAAVEIYAAPALRRAVQASLLIISCALLPLNVRDGFAWRDWYREGMEAVIKDVNAGVPRDALVERHRQYLMHWSSDRLAAGMLMLRDSRIGPFTNLSEPSSADVTAATR